MKRIGYIHAPRIKGNLNLGPGAWMAAPAGFIGLGNTQGDAFFVDPVNGDDAYDGTLPEREAGTIHGPKATTAAAYALCVDGHNDVIFRLPGTEVITATLQLNKQGLRIIGVASAPNIYKPEDCLYYWAVATGPIFEVLAPTEIAGVELCAVHAGGGTWDDPGADLMLNGHGGEFAGNFCYIHHCCFPGWGETAGISLSGGSWEVIEDCLFETGLTQGIVFWGTPTHQPVAPIIRHNIFNGPTSGIVVGGAGTEPQGATIDDNIFGGDMVNAVVVVAGWGVASNFINNKCLMLAINAMSVNRAGAEGFLLFAAGNSYRDQVDPRA